MIANLFVGIGRLTEDAELLTSPSGRPYVRFRMELPGDPQRPRKKPFNDYQTVVAYGERFVPLVEFLVAGQEVLVIGWAQSRDLPDGRVTSEIGAETVTIVASPDLLRSVADVIRSFIATANGNARALLSDALKAAPPALRTAIETALEENRGD